jgi:cobalt/nickel transport system permease protein
MHIPDGFLDAKTAITASVISAAGLGVALHQIRKSLPTYRIPLIGLSAAFIFATQMLNFPVAGGTSGHLVGGVLAAVLLGPSGAVLAMSSVVILQCLLFADGGVTALGANVFNMAILAPVAGFGIYRAVYGMLGRTLRGRLTAAAFAAWCSIVAASIACAGELSLSGIVGWNIVFPAMASVHMLIGIGEGMITALVVYALAKTRPDLLDEERYSNLRPRVRELLVYGLIVCAGLVVLVAPFASSWPDGLERVAGALGFEHMAAEAPVLASPLPDYTLPGVDSASTSVIVTGLVGTLICFGLAYLLAWRLTSRISPLSETRQDK